MARHYCKCAISPMAEARGGAHNTASGPPNVPRKGEPLPSSMDRWRPRLTGDCRVGEQKEARPGRCRPWRAARERGKRVGHRGVPHPPGATAAGAGAPVREERRPSCAEPMQRLGDGGERHNHSLHWSPSQKALVAFSERSREARRYKAGAGCSSPWVFSGSSSPHLTEGEEEAALSPGEAHHLIEGEAEPASAQHVTLAEWGQLFGFRVTGALSSASSGSSTMWLQMAARGPSDSLRVEGGPIGIKSGDAMSGELKNPSNRVDAAPGGKFIVFRQG